jgi:hypothetical protein
MHSGRCCERGFAPNDQRRLDAEAVHVFREVAVELAAGAQRQREKVMPSATAR